MSIRISGIVRAARRAHEYLAAGVPPEERVTFLQGLKRSCERVDAILQESEAEPAELPAPSRRALADLRRLAALDPDSLPAPTPGLAPPRRVGVRNVVRTRNVVLSSLAYSTSVDHTPEIAVMQARLCAEAVQGLLDEEGADPSALSVQNREAFLLLRWLGREDNAERYVRQVIRARRAIESHLEDLEASGDLDVVLPDPELPLEVRFLPGRRAWRVREKEDRIDVRLHVGYLGATEDVFQRLASVAIPPGAVCDACQARVQEYTKSSTFRAMAREFEVSGDEPDERTQGRVYDLEKLFHDLNDRYFEGAMHMPRLGWSHGTSLRTFGRYDGSRDAIGIDVRLDDASVPEFVVEFVLYHEMVHKAIPPERRNGRMHVHTPQFRREERRHPRHAEAQLWLDRLARQDAGGTRAASTPPDAGKPGDPAVPRDVLAHPAASKKIPRNAPCPCGSGHKYKKCCGAA